MIATLIMPPVTFLVPSYVMMANLGMIDTSLPVVLLWSATAVPGSIFLLSALMRGIPSEILEAARLDGAGYLETLLRIALPLSLPGIVTVMIFNVTTWWNDLLIPLVFIGQEEKTTLTAAAATIGSRFSMDFPLVLCGALPRLGAADRRLHHPDILGRIGLEQFQHDWLGSVSTAFMVLIFAFYWQTLGQGVLIFLAGLATISSDLLEAARLDGAGWWNRLTRIIIPLLVPTIAYFVLTNVIWIFVGLFGLVFTVTKGGPGYATTPFDLMIYRKAFESGDMGYASALSVILFIIVLAISAVQLRTFDRLTTDV